MAPHDGRLSESWVATDLRRIAIWRLWWTWWKRSCRVLRPRNCRRFPMSRKLCTQRLWSRSERLLYSARYGIGHTRRIEQDCLYLTRITRNLTLVRVGRIGGRRCIGRDTEENTYERGYYSLCLPSDFDWNLLCQHGRLQGDSNARHFNVWVERWP